MNVPVSPVPELSHGRGHPLLSAITRQQAAVGLGLLALIGLIYCFSALMAPFFGAGDLLADILPTIHFRMSVWSDHAWPGHTELWYGGRAQWANASWRFLYLPSTLVWLLLPLELGTDLLLVGHFIAALWAGRALAGFFVDDELKRDLSALLFASPIAASLSQGWFDAIFSWPWVLLGIRLLLGWTGSEWKDGLLAGLCLGIVALTGAMYQVGYSLLLFGLIGVSRLSWRVAVGGLCGAAIGLLHLPSVLTLGTKLREAVGYEVSLSQAVWALFVGLNPETIPLSGFAIIGAPTVALLAWTIWAWWRLPSVSRHRRLLGVALLIGAGVYLALSTGFLYQGHHFLDVFRSVSRAMAFLALSLVLLACLFVREIPRTGWFSQRAATIILAASAVQAMVVWWQVRPLGAPHWLDDSGASQVVDFLKQRGARSVWLPTDETSRLIGIGLNLNGIGLPNWYYASIGQKIPLYGPYCGLAFDFLALDSRSASAGEHALYSGIPPYREIARVRGDAVVRVGEFVVAGKEYRVYRVRC